MSPRPRLVITAGDPSGVGPRVLADALRSLPDLARSHQLIAIGAQADLYRAAQGLHRWCRLPSLPWSEAAPTIEPGAVGLLEPAGGPYEASRPGEPSPEGGRLQLACVDAAIDIIRAGQAEAMVTGPVSKIAITEAGAPFVGHTEHLARAFGVADDQVTMFFAGERLRVALVTTHLPLAEVSKALTVERVEETILRVVVALRRWWRLERPRVVVLGLNPHAGESGLFGDEERRVIAPAIVAARRHPDAEGALIEGPAPSEAGLRLALEGHFDVAIAHFHDQATIPVKLLEPQRAVNVTLGLPFLRTSVDHGVAYDAAISGSVDPGSMVAALSLAAAVTSHGPL